MVRDGDPAPTIESQNQVPIFPSNGDLTTFTQHPKLWCWEGQGLSLSAWHHRFSEPTPSLLLHDEKP